MFHKHYSQDHNQLDRADNLLNWYKFCILLGRFHILQIGDTLHHDKIRKFQNQNKFCILLDKFYILQIEDTLHHHKRRKFEDLNKFYIVLDNLKNRIEWNLYQGIFTFTRIKGDISFWSTNSLKTSNRICISEIKCTRTRITWS